MAIFFIAVIVINFIESYIKRGLAAAKDSIATSFATAGLIVAVVPIFSILFEVGKRGYKGLGFGLFTNDMSANSVNDPLGSGGLLDK